jgi:hypothetical protein
VPVGSVIMLGMATKKKTAPADSVPARPFNPAPDPQKTIEAEGVATHSIDEAQRQAEAKREASSEARDAVRASGRLHGHN